MDIEEGRNAETSIDIIVLPSKAIKNSARFENAGGH